MAGRVNEVEQVVPTVGVPVHQRDRLGLHEGSTLQDQRRNRTQDLASQRCYKSTRAKSRQHRPATPTSAAI